MEAVIAFIARYVGSNQMRPMMPTIAMDRFTYMVPQGEALVQELSWTSVEIFQKVKRAESFLLRLGFRSGDRIVLGFRGNSPVEVFLREACRNLEVCFSPLNLQADGPERITYKIELLKPKAILLAEDLVGDSLFQRVPLPVVPITSDFILPERKIPETSSGSPHGETILFTSGTTSQPKGVLLSKGAYDANELALRDLISCDDQQALRIILTNPLYHANSTAMQRFSFRRKNTHLELWDKFSNRVWNLKRLQLSCVTPKRALLQSLPMVYPLLNKRIATWPR